MSNEEQNMSMRKFLKKVGVTSQQEIEEAIRIATESGKLEKGSVSIRMTLTIEDIDMKHVVDGEIVVGS